MVRHTVGTPCEIDQKSSAQSWLVPAASSPVGSSRTLLVKRIADAVVSEVSLRLHMAEQWEQSSIGRDLLLNIMQLTLCHSTHD